MSDRVFTLLIERMRAIASRKQRFSYDVRGNSYVPVGKDGLPDLEVVLQHALDNDAVVSGYRDPADGKMWYSSCRIFTDRYNAVTFAKAQGKATVYNWNRWEEIVVNETVERSASPRLEP